MRIAIIGGSFDPIHTGHLQMARHVLSHHYANEVWFMLSAKTPLKQRKLTAYEDRKRMLELAIAHEKHMRISTLESERKGISYTYDTVMECKKRYPHHAFTWIIGNDQAMQLHHWRNIQALSQELTFLVFPRAQEQVTCAYPHVVMNHPWLDVSSSEIRNACKLWLVPKAVRNYMNAHALYMESYAQANMSERRFKHSKSVADLCVHLAKCHGLDTRKAYTAGMLHDICKEWGKDRLQVYLSSLEPQVLSQPAAIWHGYAGAYVISKFLYLHDQEVRHAIYHHVKGESMHPLAMILYVSDKLDPSRGYDSSSTIHLCEQDLKAGFQLVKEQQRMYLNQKKEGSSNE